MRNWAKNTSRAALVAAGAVAVGAGLGSAGAVAHADTRTSDNFGALNGNQISIPVDAALNLCGVSAAILGKSQALAKCEAEIKDGKGGHGGHGGHGYDDYGYGHRSGGHGGKGDVDMTTSNNFGIGNGNQVYVPINIAANVCGVSAAVVGKSQAMAKCEAEVEGDRRKPDMRTSGNYGILNGNQAYVPINAAINLCGVSVGVLGLSQAAGKCEAEIGGGGDHHLPPTKRIGHTPSPGGHTPSPGGVTEGVTSTLEKVTQGALQRTARPVAQPVANERSAKAAPAAKRGNLGATVQRVIGSLTKTTSKAGLADVQTDNVETSLPLNEMPLKAGAPSLG